MPGNWKQEERVQMVVEIRKPNALVIAGAKTGAEWHEPKKQRKRDCVRT